LKESGEKRVEIRYALQNPYLYAMNPDTSQFGPFDPQDMQAAVEALIFASTEPVSAAAIASTLREADERVGISDNDIDQLVDSINAELLEQHRPYSIEMIAGGYTFLTR